MSGDGDVKKQLVKSLTTLVNIAQTLCKDEEKSEYERHEDTETTLRKPFPSTNGKNHMGESSTSDGSDGHRKKGKSMKATTLTRQICNKKLFQRNHSQKP